MKKAAEEKRRAAELQIEEAEKKRKTRDEEARQKAAAEREAELAIKAQPTVARGESPPIPTHQPERSKTQPPGSFVSSVLLESFNVV